MKLMHTNIAIIRCWLFFKHKDFTPIVAELGRNKDENNNPLLCRDEQMGFPFGLFFHSTAASKIDSDVLTAALSCDGIKSLGSD